MVCNNFKRLASFFSVSFFNVVLDVEHVSFSEDDASDAKGSDDDDEGEKKSRGSPKKETPKSKSKTPTASRKSSIGAEDGGVLQGIRRSLTNRSTKKGEKESDSYVSFCEMWSLTNPPSFKCESCSRHRCQAKSFPHNHHNFCHTKIQSKSPPQH